MPQMFRNPLSLILGLLVVLAVGAGADRPAAGADRPNIVLIMVDDMGYADAGCYGGQAIATPNLDRMAEQGIRFTQAYSGSTVCAPARSVLMTGLHAGHTPVRGNTGGIALRDEDVTVAEVLKQAGYATGGFGKWGLGDLETPGAAERQGFDRFFGYYHQVHAHSFYPEMLIDTGSKVELPGNVGFSRTTQNPRLVEPIDPETGRKRQYSHDLIAGETLQFVREHRDEPFFCYAAWTPPHGRYEIPADDPAVAMYRDQPWPEKAKVIAAMVTMVDRQVGELLDLLEELELTEQTLVLFCSDHGAAERMDGSLESCGPLRGRKRAMYEGGLRVPLIARWPGTAPSGEVSDHPTYFGDMMSTFAELANATDALPAELDSLSLVPTLTGHPEDQATHEWLYWEWPTYNWGQKTYTGLMQAVRQGDWKLLRDSQDQPWQLYDLSQDLGEQTDLANEHPEIVERLAALAEEAHRPAPPQIEPKKPAGRRYR